MNKKDFANSALSHLKKKAKGKTGNEGLDLLISLIITYIRSTHFVCHDFDSKKKGQSRSSFI